MNILVIPSWYCSGSNKVKGAFFREQALMMCKNSVNQVAVCYVEFHKPKEKIREKEQIYIDEGLLTIVRHIHSYGYAKIHFLYVLVLLIQYLMAYRTLSRHKFKPDVIHAHAFRPAGIVSTIIGQLFNIKVIVTEHSSYVHTLSLTRAETFSLNYVVKHCHSFCAVSESLANSIRQYCPRSIIKILPNNVSPIFTYNANQKKSNELLFVSCGNLIPDKNMLFLVTCFNKAFAKDDGVKLYIAGDGVERNLIEEYIREHKLCDKVILLGRISRVDMCELLKRCHIFTLLSKHETFGVSYIEALACGCPIIAAKNGGANELVTSDNGILVDVDNEEQTIHALKKMVISYSHYNLTNISQSCTEEYGEDNVYSKTLDIYEN